ncbi:MAG: hypothetical protein SGJ23_05365 [Alphaproteobacteria bacterium]|nr:hypothetical protein [Alphaproteobacteria bacterium]
MGRSVQEAFETIAVGMSQHDAVLALADLKMAGVIQSAGSETISWAARDGVVILTLADGVVKDKSFVHTGAQTTGLDGATGCWSSLLGALVALGLYFVWKGGA